MWHRSTAAGVAEFVVESAATPTEIPLIVRRWSSAADTVRPQVRNQPPLARFLPSSVEEFNRLESVDAQRSFTSSGCTLNRAKYDACRFSDRELLPLQLTPPSLVSDNVTFPSTSSQRVKRKALVLRCSGWLGVLFRSIPAAGCRPAAVLCESA